MALQFIFGNSGAGKSHFIYETIIQAAQAAPLQEFVVLVPEQFTMETQKILARMHPDGGILNIDVLSFERLAYRIFEEVGSDTRQILEETGKGLVLQKVVQLHEKELVYLGGQLKKPGYIDELKSLLSEFMQYQVGPEALAEMKEQAKEENSLLYYKLCDVQILYTGFLDYLSDRYQTSEELLELLAHVLEKSRWMAGCTVALDGFTGFTPIQKQVLGRLFALCPKVYVTVTLAFGEDPYRLEKSHRLFSMSQKTIHALCQLADEANTEILPEIWLQPVDHWRFSQAPALNFLEQNLFRYRRGEYRKEQEEIHIFAAPAPLAEMEETAVRIAHLVRTKGWRYGEIAVLTGDLETYGNYARQAFSQANIPFFIDEKHTVLVNPFVEYLRASVEVILKNCSYESMFRYLRCGMGSLTPQETDLLENYVLALGVRGKKRWQETWVRVYPGMDEGDILAINQLRQKVTDDLQPLLAGWTGRRHTVRTLTSALYEFIVRGHIQEKLKVMEHSFQRAGDAAMEKEYAQIYGIIMNLFDKMVEILGDETMTLAQYQQLLEAGLSQAKVALIPPNADQVLVGDMERSRLKDIKALFFVGTNDGNIPKEATGSGILSETDRLLIARQGVELAPDAREQMGEQRFYLYLNLTRPSRQLTLSYSYGNARGEAQNPAYLISAILQLFPGLSVEEQSKTPPLSRLEHPSAGLFLFLEGLRQKKEALLDDALWWELYRWYQNDARYGPIVEKFLDAAFYENPDAPLSQAVAKALYGEISPYGATRLEKFAACAFAHFLQYGLQLRERAVYEFQPADFGNLMHRALELFTRKLREENLFWQTLTAEQRTALGSEALREASADYGNTILESSARYAYQYRRMERILQRTLWALQEQLRRGSFTPEGFEVSFQGGRIDRVDVCETPKKVYVKVIDYKTGNTAFDLLELYHGLQLQLVVYLKGALEIEREKHPGQEVAPAGIFYYNVKDPLITVKKQGDLARLAESLPGTLKLSGLVLAEEDAARMLDATLETIPVRLKKDGDFDAHSSVASARRFTLLTDFTEKKIASLQKKILAGETQAAPYQLGKKDACAYCAFAGVCGFDGKLPGFSKRKLAELEKETLWAAMEMEGDVSP